MHSSSPILFFPLSQFLNVLPTEVYYIECSPEFQNVLTTEAYYTKCSANFHTAVVLLSSARLNSHTAIGLVSKVQD